MWSAVSTAIFSLALIAAMLPTVASAAVPPPTAPAAPTSVTVVGSAGQIAATWVVGNDGGTAIGSFTATASPGGASCTVAGPSATTCNLGGTNGIAYTVSVTATNTAGTSPASASSSSVTAGANPVAATPNVAGTALSGEVAASWTAATTTYGLPVSYTVQAWSTGTFPAAIAGKTCTISALTCTVTGLTPTGTYKFAVTATTAAGSHTSGFSGNITPNAIPGPPTITTVTPGSGKLTIAFTAGSTGGSPITGYDVWVTPSAASIHVGGSATSAVLTGLINGVPYTPFISATNANGTSTSATAAAATPVAKASAPTNVVATPFAHTTAGTTRKVIVTWDVSSYDGGSPITQYLVTAKNAAGTAVGYCLTTLAKGSTANTRIITGGTFTLVPAGVTASLCSNITDDAPFSYSVHAITNAGAGTESASATATSTNAAYPPVTPAALLPSAPTANPFGGATASVTDAKTGGSVVVAWNPVTTPGDNPVNGYVVKNLVSTSPGCTTTGALSCTVSGLTDGVNAEFTVFASSSDGTETTGIASALGVKPSGPPTTPAIVSATANSTTATLTWTALSDTAPANGNSTINGTGFGYLVKYTGGATGQTLVPFGTNFKTVTASSAVTFTIEAVNANGSSATATASVTPSATPSAPQNLVITTAAPASTTVLKVDVSLGWGVPAVSGATTSGGLVYAAVAQPGSISGVVTGTTALFSDLVYNTAYTFSVTASTSSPAAVVTGPAATGSIVAGLLYPAPTVTSVTHGATPGVLEVAWSAGAAPSTTVGSPPPGTITPAQVGYTVTTYKAGVLVAGLGCSTVTVVSCAVSGLTAGTVYEFMASADNSVGSNQSALSTIARQAPGVPGDPTGVTLVQTDTTSGNLTLAWTETAAATGQPALGSYVITVTPAGSSGSPLTPVAGSNAQVITGLTKGVEYTVVIQETNSVGSSAGVTKTATSAVKPNAPTAVSAAAGDGQAVMSWTAAAGTNADGGSPITGYKITGTPALPTTTPDTVVANITGDVSTGTIEGLLNGVAYTFVVQAVNAVGAGASSTPASTAVTPAAVPGAPSGVTAVATAYGATVSWIPSAFAGGVALSNFSVSTPGGTSCLNSGVASLSCEVTGLSGATTYTLSVVANNAAGSSAAGTVTVTTPRAAPEADSTVNHTFGDVSGLSADAQSAIAALQNLGIANGMNATTYGAGTFVLREHMALFVARTLTVLGLTPNNTVNHTFADVSGLNTETQNAIAWLNNLGIVNGVNATTYGTGSFVLREHMALFISRSMAALGLPTDTTVNHTFADVGGLNTETQNAVASINNAGISVGLNATTYGTGNDVVRENMALFIVRLLNLGLGVL